MESLIKKYFEKYKIEISQKQITQFVKFFDYLTTENEKFNLTAITQPDEVVIKHFIDSVLPAYEIPKNAKVIDVGTGAGFPGIPLKIMREDIEIVLLDSLQKRVKFLEELKNLLGLDKVKCVHARAEDYVKESREIFDVATSRAVASIPTLSEYLLPYVKVGGRVLMYKGAQADEEISAGKKAIKTMGGEIERVEKFRLDEVESERNIVLIKKISRTNSIYPRGKNLPKTKPVV